MRRLSARRVREIIKIDEERGKVQAELCRLFDQIDKDGWSKENDLLAARLERENKSLYEKRAELWRAVLALDGVELSSKEITKEQMRVEKEIRELQRILSRGRKDEILDQERLTVLSRLIEADNRLRISRTDLEERQREYQLAQATAKSKKRAKNHTESKKGRHPNG